MLQLIDITKKFMDGKRALTVLDHLTLTVDDGEFVAVTGESGSGKTTLLSLLGTLLEADSGTYTFDGKMIDNDDLCEIRNKKIGFVFQDHRLLPQLTALQNILLPVLASNETCPKEAMERAQELMSFMGIEALSDSSVTVLSGGEKTRVAICRALINNPSLLLADEPTGQLDAENTKVIADLFTKINKELHTTIVMVTHSEAMAKVAQRVYMLEKGQLMEELTSL